MYDARIVCSAAVSKAHSIGSVQLSKDRNKKQFKKIKKKKKISINAGIFKTASSSPSPSPAATAENIYLFVSDPPIASAASS